MGRGVGLCLFVFLFVFDAGGWFCLRNLLLRVGFGVFRVLFGCRLFPGLGFDCACLRFEVVVLGLWVLCCAFAFDMRVISCVRVLVLRVMFAYLIVWFGFIGVWGCGLFLFVCVSVWLTVSFGY